MTTMGAIAARADAPVQSPVTAAAIAEAHKPAPWPTFASAPPAPTDVRSLRAWKTSVLTIRAAGAELSREAAAEPWTLSDSEGWANTERGQAVPPRPITTASSQADTEAYAAALRARATPPPRKR